MQIVTWLLAPLPSLLYASYDELVVIPNYIKGEKVKRREVNVKKNRDIKTTNTLSSPYPFTFSPFHFFTFSPFHLFTFISL